MNKNVPVKDYSQKIVGWLEETDSYIIAKDFNTRILGRYDKKLDRTTDYFGHILSQGNSVTALIFNPKYNKKLK